MANSTKTSQTGKVWFITGASTGFGRLLAEEVLKAGRQGCCHGAKARQGCDLETKYPDTAKALALDVTNQAQVDSAVEQTLREVRPRGRSGEQRGVRRRRRDRRGLRGGVYADVRDQCVWPAASDARVSAATSQAAKRAHSQSLVHWRRGRRPRHWLLQRDEVCGRGDSEVAGRGACAAGDRGDDH